jgi:acyl-CoA synthetase (AMP-forming)/AMP-acid ligase II
MLVRDEMHAPSLAAHLQQWAERTPDREAAVDGQTRLSYRQLTEAVEQCARALIATGVRTGDCVAMLTTPRLEFLLTLLALHRIGGVWLGLNPRQRLGELQHIVSDAAPKLLIGIESFEGRDFLADLGELAQSSDLLRAPVIIRGEEPTLDFLAALGGREVHDDELFQAAAALAPASPSCIVYTSGSTGEPKGAVLCHYGQLRAYRQWLSYLGTQRYRMVCDLPVDHVGGIAPIFLSLMSGGAVVFQRRFDPRALLECIQRERITVWSGELTQWIKCAPLLDRYELSSLQAIGYGGGPPPRDLLERYTKVAPRIFSGYGMTETSDAIMFTDPGTPVDVLCDHNVGRPLEGVLTRLVSATGEWVGREGTGELEVRSSSVFLEYFSQPEATDAAFSADGWLRTGDIMRERPDGTFDFLGRADHTFKSGGYNIYPREIECVLEAHPAIGSAAVVGVPDAVFQAVGYAFVEPAADQGAPRIDELRAHCMACLANYKVPKTIELLEALPKLRNEKVDRLLLQERARQATERRR